MRIHSCLHTSFTLHTPHLEVGQQLGNQLCDEIAAGQAVGAVKLLACELGADQPVVRVPHAAEIPVQGGGPGSTLTYFCGLVAPHAGT